VRSERTRLWGSPSERVSRPSFAWLHARSRQSCGVRSISPPTLRRAAAVTTGNDRDGDGDEDEAEVPRGEAVCSPPPTLHRLRRARPAAFRPAGDYAHERVAGKMRT